MNQRPSLPPRVRLAMHGRNDPTLSSRRLGLIGLCWLLSLLLVAGVCWLFFSSGGGDLCSRLRTSEDSVEQQKQAIGELTQRQATLQASDQISRAALSEVQASLAERDEEIAGLRAEVAFYERLVGATSQRKGLTAHSVEFAAEAAGSWHYTVVLTQNLNRGAISKGQMRLLVEGVKDGKLVTVGWDDLHQRKGVPGQEYSFRYFQQLDGSVMLPKDFTPQRVRVSLSGGGVSATQNFEWKLAGSGRGE